MIDHGSRHSVREEIKNKGFYLTKKRGQNFLVDNNIRNFIVNSVLINETDIVWEIGGGFGSMSCLLAQKTKKLTIFELDKGFAEVLKEIHGAKVVCGDFLETFSKELEEGAPKYIFGNLPYNVSSRIIAKLIEENMFLDKAIFMLQKEMFERIRAERGSKNYSSYSVFTQCFLNYKLLKEVKGGSFFPKPNVDSVIVQFCRKQVPEIKDINLFEKIVRTAFSSRRKTLLNNYKSICGGENNARDMFLKLEIDCGKRAEELGVNDFIKIYLFFV